MWEGKDGVIQLVIPAEIGGKDGAALKSFTAEAQSGKSLVPTAAPPTPTRGLSYVNDDLALGAWTVAPCPEGGVTGPTGPTGAAGLERLPVTLLTRSAKAKTAKKGKKLKLKVRSTEAITNLAVQIRSAKKTFARGRLASLNGTATLKLKLRKALKKGAYVVDLVGDDSLGRHRVTAARLRVR
jgi:hypothetical protein